MTKPQDLRYLLNAQQRPQAVEADAQADMNVLQGTHVIVGFILL